MVDTNSDPKEINFVIPSNDDASKSITKILEILTSSILEGLNERNKEKEEINDSDLKRMKSESMKDDSTEKENVSKDSTEKSKKENK